MNECVEDQVKTFGFTRLAPTGREQDNIGYASRPDRSSDFRHLTPKPGNIPSFVNAIHLKTFDSNLYLNFGFCQDANEGELTGITNPSNQVVMSSETAKQLLISLAELFQCDLTPKNK